MEQKTKENEDVENNYLQSRLSSLDHLLQKKAVNEVLSFGSVDEAEEEKLNVLVTVRC